jgi:hypothetical protein
LEERGQQRWQPQSGNGYSAFGKIDSDKSGQDFWLYTWTFRQKQVRTKTVKKLTATWRDTKTSKLTKSQILYCRPKTLRFKVTGLKPNTKHHVFFDKRAVNKYSGPLSKEFTFDGPGSGRVASQSKSFTSKSGSDVSRNRSPGEYVRAFPDITISPAHPSPNQGLQLKTDDKGQLVGFFMIPDHRGKQDVPKFPTGARELLVTSNTKNEKGIVFSLATDEYRALGETRTTTTQVTSTKVPKITTTTSSESRTIDARAYAFGGSWYKNLMSSNQWRSYSPNETKGDINRIIQVYINDGILERRYYNGSYQLRTTAKYQTLSPGQYNRDTIGTVGFPIVDQSAFYQTFHMERASGYFATSIYLYFTTKARHDPVTISIVTTKEGRPQLIELPYSAVTLNPDEVNADVTGETFTKFTFPSPVYLKGDEKYAIRINSKGDMYKVKTGKETIGERKNPMVSEMFLPYAQGPEGSGPSVENSATYDSHMRFTLQCAIFDTAETGGKVTMRNEPTGELMTLENGESAYAKRLIERNPIELTNSITKVKVTHFDHGMYSTSNNVQISGVKSGVTTTLNGSITKDSTKLVLKSFAGFSSGSIHAGSGVIHVKIDNELFAGTLSGSTLTVSSRGYTDYGTTSAISTAHSDGATVELYMLYGTYLNEINKIHTAIADIEMNSYTVSITTAPTITGSSTTIRAGGTEIFASENVRYDLFKTSVSSLEFASTAISAKVRQTTGTSPGGSETSFTTTTTAKALPFALNQEYALQNTAIIASPPNETNEMNSLGSLFFDLRLTTDSSFLSPVIDLTSPAVICIANRLDNVDSASDVYTPSGENTKYRAHTEPVGDSNTTSYITKPVQLENTATGIKLYLDVHKPATSEVKAMYRVLPAEGEDDIKNIPFTFFNAGASRGGSVPTNGLPDSGVATNAKDITDFVEYKYTAGINDFGFGDQLQDFQQFQIKLVMQGTNAATPPRIMNLRAIALAT